jgi:hypothetical protein
MEGFAMASRKIGRDATTGQFIPVKHAQRDKKGAVVESIKQRVPAPPAPPVPPRKAAKKK